jgi:hypothetical protein
MNDPYSRVYWCVMDDTKFDGIREDVRLFGTWSLMLVVADMAWPAPAFVPPTVPKWAVVRLAEAGLLDVLGGSRFRVHGLAAEREKRSHSARNAAAVRWHSERNAEPMLDEDETRTRRGRDEIPPPPTSGGRRKERTNPRATGTAPRQIGTAPRANGASPRQKRDQEKRSGMPASVSEILRRAAAEGKG